MTSIDYSLIERMRYSKQCGQTFARIVGPEILRFSQAVKLSPHSLAIIRWAFIYLTSSPT